jgi:hypothetical protein
MFPPADFHAPVVGSKIAGLVNEFPYPFVQQVRPPATNIWPDRSRVAEEWKIGGPLLAAVFQT